MSRERRPDFRVMTSVAALPGDAWAAFLLRSRQMLSWSRCRTSCARNGLCVEWNRPASTRSIARVSGLPKQTPPRHAEYVLPIFIRAIPLRRTARGPELRHYRVLRHEFGVCGSRVTRRESAKPANRFRLPRGERSSPQDIQEIRAGNFADVQPPILRPRPGMIRAASDWRRGRGGGLGRETSELQAGLFLESLLRYALQGGCGCLIMECVHCIQRIQKFQDSVGWSIAIIVLRRPNSSGIQLPTGRG